MPLGGKRRFSRPPSDGALRGQVRVTMQQQVVGAATLHLIVVHKSAMMVFMHQGLAHNTMLSLLPKQNHDSCAQ